MMTILGNGSRRIGRIGMLGQKVTCTGVKEDLNKSIVDFSEQTAAQTRFTPCLKIHYLSQSILAPRPCGAEPLA